MAQGVGYSTNLLVCVIVKTYFIAFLAMTLEFLNRLSLTRFLYVPAGKNSAAPL